MIYLNTVCINAKLQLVENSHNTLFQSFTFNIAMDAYNF